MSAPRSGPPTIEGFEYREYLGGGGFADVFLYQQLRPRRQVAIKVLRNAVTDSLTRQLFDTETDLMASVSHHPYIVSVFDASVAPDGRPYIVMEYYPPPNYLLLSKQRTIPVPEVLRVGVQIASAVETAHRHGIIHRDIKPANILIDSYGRPGLTDFGISSGSATAEDDVVGLSYAYAPPEVIEATSNGDVHSDVYSLAATLYALLCGRAPFDREARNSTPEIRERVLNDAPPETGRSGVPRSLEFLIRQGLSKRPTDRPSSALAFARALREIEIELSLDPTAIELQSNERSNEREPAQTSDSPATRAAARTIDPSIPRAHVRNESQGAATPHVDAVELQQAGTVVRDGPNSSHRPSHTAKTDDGQRSNGASLPESRPRQAQLATRWKLVGAVGVVCAIAGIAIASLNGKDDPEAQRATTTRQPDVIIDPDGMDAPTIDGVKRLPDGKVEITWTPSGDSQQGDRYVVAQLLTQTDEKMLAQDIDATSAIVSIDRGRLCVYSVRGATRSQSTCDDVPETLPTTKAP